MSIDPLFENGLSWHLLPSKGTGKQNLEYCSKDGVFKEFGTMIPEIGKRGRDSQLSLIVEDIKNGATMQELWENHTEGMIKHANGVSLAFKRLRKVEKPVPYELASFPWTIHVDLEWNRSIILWGDSGIGKTCYANAILPKALVVSHIDDLRTFDSGVHEGIIFDDMSFNHLPRQAQIHLLDVDFDRSIHCRYDTALIPRNTKKIFTCNHNDIFDFNDTAINRRSNCIHLIKI